MVNDTTSQPTAAVGLIEGGKPLGPVLIAAEEQVRLLPVIEESLEVNKERVDRGGYRITKRVEMRDEVVDEFLQSEDVHIERRAVNTAIADDAIPGIRQEGDTLIVPVIEEMLITVKRLVLVEEVRITRTKNTHHKSQTYTLRKEHIEVERLAAEQPSTVKSS